MATSESCTSQKTELGKRWVSNHQRQVFVTMKQWRKRQNLNYEVTSGFANSGNRSTHAEQRKLIFANGRTQKAMGQ